MQKEIGCENNNLHLDNIALQDEDNLEETIFANI